MLYPKDIMMDYEAITNFIAFDGIEYNRFYKKTVRYEEDEWCIMSSRRNSPNVPEINSSLFIDLKKSLFIEIATEFDLIIAGGFLVGMVKERKMYDDSDVNFFMRYKGVDKGSYVNDIINFIMLRHPSTYTFSKSKFAVTIECVDFKVQLILKNFPSIDNLFDNFDLDLCKIAWYDNSLYFHTSALFSLTYSVILIDGFLTNTLSDLINKYTSTRGFQPQFTKSINLIPINNMGICPAPFPKWYDDIYSFKNCETLEGLIESL